MMMFDNKIIFYCCCNEKNRTKTVTSSSKLYLHGTNEKLQYLHVWPLFACFQLEQKRYFLLALGSYFND
jgi:hypothetical protein